MLRVPTARDLGIGDGNRSIGSVCADPWFVDCVLFRLSHRGFHGLCPKRNCLAEIWCDVNEDCLQWALTTYYKSTHSFWGRNIHHCVRERECCVRRHVLTSVRRRVWVFVFLLMSMFVFVCVFVFMRVFVFVFAFVFVFVFGFVSVCPLQYTKS